jgi:hypothetical protein
VEAAHIRWRPLGRLLVEQGLLGEAELEHALTEQESTGRRLGETLIELGFVSHAALSQALAEQYGFEPKTETGFGTGLRAELERREAAQPAPEALPALRLLPGPEETPEPEAVADESLYLAQLEEQWAKLAEAEDRLAEAERELTSLRRLAERRRNQAKRLVERIRKRDRRLAELPAAEPVEPDPTHSTHLVYAQLTGRYVLVERDGDPPEPGTIIELAETGEEAETMIACRIGKSPLPNDPRPCVFAEPFSAPRG